MPLRPFLIPTLCAATALAACGDGQSATAPAAAARMLVDQHGAIDEPNTTDISHVPRYVPLPAGLLRTHNELVIHIRADAMRSAGLTPVTIGDGSNTAAGSTINQDVDKSQLAVARARQRNIDGWKRPVKIKKS
mgnify:CR=1 FL=1